MVDEIFDFLLYLLLANVTLKLLNIFRAILVGLLADGRQNVCSHHKVK